MSKKVGKRHVDLLLIANDDINHYCFTKDFGRLVGSQYSRGNNKTDSACMVSLGILYLNVKIDSIGGRMKK